MIQIGDDFVEHALSFGQTQDMIADAFAALARDEAAIHARQRSSCGDFRLATMGASWPAQGLALTKCYSAVGGRFDFHCTLFDTGSGRALCTISGDQLTGFRTAALSMMAIANAANRTSTVALIGAGFQGAAHLQALVQRFHVDEILVADPRDVGDWCAATSLHLRVPMRQVPANEAVSEADVVITTTRSKTPVFDGNHLRQGALVVAVGTSTRDGCELDDKTLRRTNRMIVEWLPQSLNEAGELHQGIVSGALDMDRVAAIPDLLRDRRPWRELAQEIIVFKAVGVGLSDLAAAALVWRAWQAAEH